VAADAECGGYGGQVGLGRLAACGGRADPGGQRAVVFSADPGPRRAGPDPEGDTHHTSVPFHRVAAA